MKYLICAFAMFAMTAPAIAQTVIEPFVKPDEVRYGYALMPEAVQFESNGKTMLGFLVVKADKVQGGVTAIGIGGRLALRWTTPDGRKEVYVPSPRERMIVTQHPLPLFVCDGKDHACNGRVFVVPPLAGMRVTPPATPPVPQAKPKPAPASPPQALETRSDVRPAIHRPSFFPQGK